VVVMGPGNIGQAHQPNEYLSLAQINPAVELIRKLIIDSCLQETLLEAS
jgi:acetylornithine deacetylase